MRIILICHCSAVMLLTQSALAATPSIEFVAVPAGTFLMGTQHLEDALIEMPPDNHPDITDEQPLHEVSLSAFDIGKYEITQGQWHALMGTKPGPQAYWQGRHWRDLPVVSVSWHDTQDFINKLNQQDSAYHYRLPSEAEWEYVARGDNTDVRPFASELMDDYAWSINNSRDTPQAVGQLRANRLGVHDMFGNAWEWVNDWYAADSYSNHSKIDPTGPINGDKKVRRGGSYHCASHFVRSAYRAADVPSQRYSVLGFRLVRQVKQR